MGWSPLYKACENGHAIVVRALLQHGAEPDLQGKLGGAPLHAVAIRGLTKIAKLLILAGANVNAAQAVSDVCLGLGPGVAEVLAPFVLCCCLRPNCQDGWTPLHLAALNGHLSLSRLLLKNGASARTEGSVSSALLLAAVKCGSC